MFRNLKSKWMARLLAGGFLAGSAALAVPVLADTQKIVTGVCAACHGGDGNGTDSQFPRLAGQDAGYLRKQLRDFAEGKRHSEIMEPIASQLGDGDVTALASYFSSQKPTPPRGASNGLTAMGRQLYEDGNTESGVPACAGCHGADGLGNARFPRLAGQHAPYLLKELQEFKAGYRANNRLMNTVCERLTKAEMEALAAFISGL